MDHVICMNCTHAEATSRGKLNEARRSSHASISHDQFFYKKLEYIFNIKSVAMKLIIRNSIHAN